MNRVLLVLPIPLLSVVLLGLWLTSTPAAIGARYGLGECRHVTVTAGGRTLTGIEDLAALPDGRLLLSARDRRSGEAGSGALYTVASAAFPGRTLVEATPLPGAGAGLDPHGVAVAEDGRRLAFVNAPGSAAAAIIWGRLDRGRFAEEGRLAGAEWCRANDLGYQGGLLYVTRDRGSCGTALSDLMPGSRTGSVARVALGTGGASAETVAEGFSFANGIQVWHGRVLVAETRGARLSALDGGPPIALPGGPDNLNPAPGGRLTAALQPDLFRLALWMAGLVASAPSRIALIDPETGEVEVLFDDPSGSRFSGATAAVMADGQLFAGSAFDHGLLVCGSGA